MSTEDEVFDVLWWGARRRAMSVGFLVTVHKQHRAFQIRRLISTSTNVSLKNCCSLSLLILNVRPVGGRRSDHLIIIGARVGRIHSSVLCLRRTERDIRN